MKTPKYDLMTRLWSQTGLVQILALLLTAQVSMPPRFLQSWGGVLSRGGQRASRPFHSVAG